MSQSDEEAGEKEGARGLRHTRILVIGCGVLARLGKQLPGMVPVFACDVTAGSRRTICKSTEMHISNFNSNKCSNAQLTFLLGLATDPIRRQSV